MEKCSKRVHQIASDPWRFSGGAVVAWAGHEEKEVEWGMKIKELKEAAKDLNKVLGCEPPIDVKGDEAILEADIKEAAELLVPSDKIKPGTRKVIDELIKEKKGAPG